jgi:hypothetical protein
MQINLRGSQDKRPAQFQPDRSELLDAQEKSASNKALASFAQSTVNFAESIYKGGQAKDAAKDTAAIRARAAKVPEMVEKSAQDGGNAGDADFRHPDEVKSFAGVPGVTPTFQYKPGSPSPETRTPMPTIPAPVYLTSNGKIGGKAAFDNEFDQRKHAFEAAYDAALLRGAIQGRDLNAPLGAQIAEITNTLLFNLDLAYDQRATMDAVKDALVKYTTDEIRTLATHEVFGDQKDLSKEALVRLGVREDDIRHIEHQWTIRQKEVLTSAPAATLYWASSDPTVMQQIKALPFSPKNPARLVLERMQFDFQQTRKILDENGFNSAQLNQKYKGAESNLIAYMAEHNKQQASATNPQYLGRYLGDQDSNGRSVMHYPGISDGGNSGTRQLPGSTSGRGSSPTKFTKARFTADSELTEHAVGLLGDAVAEKVSEDDQMSMLNDIFNAPGGYLSQNPNVTLTIDNMGVAWAQAQMMGVRLEGSTLSWDPKHLKNLAGKHKDAVLKTHGLTRIINPDGPNGAYRFEKEDGSFITSAGAPYQYDQIMDDFGMAHQATGMESNGQELEPEATAAFKPKTKPVLIGDVSTFADQEFFIELGGNPDDYAKSSEAAIEYVEGVNALTAAGATAATIAAATAAVEVAAGTTKKSMIRGLTGGRGPKIKLETIAKALKIDAAALEALKATAKAELLAARPGSLPSATKIANQARRTLIATIRGDKWGTTAGWKALKNVRRIEFLAKNGGKLVKGSGRLMLGLGKGVVSSAWTHAKTLANPYVAVGALIRWGTYKFTDAINMAEHGTDTEGVYRQIMTRFYDEEGHELSASQRLWARFTAKDTATGPDGEQHPIGDTNMAADLARSSVDIAGQWFGFTPFGNVLGDGLSVEVEVLAIGAYIGGRSLFPGYDEAVLGLESPRTEPFQPMGLNLHLRNIVSKAKNLQENAGWGARPLVTAANKSPRIPASARPMLNYMQRIGLIGPDVQEKGLLWMSDNGVTDDDGNLLGWSETFIDPANPLQPNREVTEYYGDLIHFLDGYISDDTDSGPMTRQEARVLMGELTAEAGASPVVIEKVLEELREVGIAKSDKTGELKEYVWNNIPEDLKNMYGAWNADDEDTAEGYLDWVSKGSPMGDKHGDVTYLDFPVSVATYLGMNDSEDLLEFTRLHYDMRSDTFAFTAQPKKDAPDFLSWMNKNKIEPSHPSELASAYMQYQQHMESPGVINERLREESRMQSQGDPFGQVTGYMQNRWDQINDAGAAMADDRMEDSEKVAENARLMSEDKIAAHEFQMVDHKDFATLHSAMEKHWMDNFKGSEPFNKKLYEDDKTPEDIRKTINETLGNIERELQAEEEDYWTHITENPVDSLRKVRSLPAMKESARRIKMWEDETMRLRKKLQDVNDFQEYWKEGVDQLLGRKTNFIPGRNMSEQIRMALRAERRMKDWDKKTSMFPPMVESERRSASSERQKLQGGMEKDVKDAEEERRKKVRDQGDPLGQVSGANQ